MLIGGPNQSYKVNFKEPLPAMGKISKKTSAFWSVNSFPEEFEKRYGRNAFAFLVPRPPHHVERDKLIEGIAENANCLLLIKIFLIKKLMDWHISLKQRDAQLLFAREYQICRRNNS